MSRGHIGLDAALERLRGGIVPVVPEETVALAEATGRVLASPLLSPRAVPSFDNAAVDGFAFAASSQASTGPTRLALVQDRAAAGHPAGTAVPPGHAIRVLTGAVMPAGTDTVAMQEEVALDEGSVTIARSIRASSNRRRAGEDIAAGATLFGPGLMLRPHHVAVAAEIGLARLPVFAPLRLALLSSGDELREPGDSLPPGAVFDANRYLLRGLLRHLPVEVDDLGILPDDAEAVAAALQEAAQNHHVILTSGGASKGDEDHVVRTVERHGRLHFWQIAMKPGRPLAFGQLGKALTIGLPGNPVAAAVCFMRLARPVLARLAGADWLEPRAFAVPAAFEMTKPPGRTELLRARLVPDVAGSGHAAEIIRRQGSGILTSLTDADGLVEVDDDTTRIEVGDLVRFFSFNELGAL